MEAPKLEAKLDEILQRVGDVSGEVRELRQEFRHHSESDAAFFLELKTASTKHGDAIHRIELWQAGLAGAKAGAAPFWESAQKILIPLLLAALVALGGAYFSGR